MAIPATLPAFRSEEAKSRQLLVSKRRATALLAGVTLVFVGVTVAGADGWLGYVQATAEASMVGGLADWFAVVALFRRPLGLPIPHTAIVVERKVQFGETLGQFIQDSFLTPDSVLARVRAANVPVRLADWLATPANAHRLAGYAFDAAVAVADLVRDEDVQRTLEQVVRTRVEAVPLAPLGGQALRFLTADGRHHEALDAAFRAADRYLDEHQGELRQRLARQAPWWLPGAVEDRIFVRLLDGVHRLLAELASNPEHELRRELDARIERFARELETSPELRARGEQLKRDLLDQPQLREWAAAVWQDAKNHLREQAADPDSELRRRLADAIAAGGARLREDPALSGAVQDGVETAGRYVVEHFDGEIATLVSGTIARWDAEETARRLELLLGPDLQFIRINGTVVGGLAGLVLHTVASALS